MKRFALVALACFSLAGIARADQTADGTILVSTQIADHSVTSYTYSGTVTTDDYGRYQSFSTDDDTTFALSPVNSCLITYEDPSNSGSYWQLNASYVLDGEGGISSIPFGNMWTSDAPSPMDPIIVTWEPDGGVSPMDPVVLTWATWSSVYGTIQIVSSDGSWATTGVASFNGNDPYIEFPGAESFTINGNATWQVTFWAESYGEYWVWTGSFGSDGADGLMVLSSYGFTTTTVWPNAPEAGASTSGGGTFSFPASTVFGPYSEL